MNTGVDGKFDEHSKEKLARMLYDLLNTDHKTPLIVAWDRVREKVSQTQIAPNGLTPAYTRTDIIQKVHAPMDETFIVDLA